MGHNGPLPRIRDRVVVDLDADGKKEVLVLATGQGEVAGFRIEW